MEKQLLDSVKELKFYKMGKTKSRRGKPQKQIQCKGEYCKNQDISMYIYKYINIKLSLFSGLITCTNTNFKLHKGILQYINFQSFIFNRSYLGLYNQIGCSIWIESSYGKLWRYLNYPHQ